MRSFVALPVPEVLAAPLFDLASSWQAGRVLDPVDMHVTLAFLDDQPEQVLADLHDELSLIRAEAQPLVTTGLEPFGGAQPRLIAASLTLTPELEALRGRVRAAARSLGIALPRERFRPHITLVRWGRRVTPGAGVAKALSSGLDPNLPQPLATSMALYQSTLSPQGARYDILAEYPLVPPAGAPA